MVIDKLLLAIAATNHWILIQLYVSNAFLHGEYTEEVYIELPPDIINKGSIMRTNLYVNYINSYRV